jgi:hypothetical protein
MRDVGASLQGLMFAPPDPQWVAAGLNSLITPSANGRVHDAMRPAVAPTYTSITAGEMKAGLSFSNQTTATGSIVMPGACQGQTFSRIAVLGINQLSSNNVVSDSRSTNNVGGAVVQISSSGQVSLVKGNIIAIFTSAAGVVAAGAEFVVGVTYDGTTGRLYVDGRLVTSGTSAQTFNIDSSARLFQAGGSGSWLNGQMALHADFIGALDEATMRALTADPTLLFRAPKRRVPQVVGPAPTFNPVWARHSNSVIQGALHA